MSAKLFRLGSGIRHSAASLPFSKIARYFSCFCLRSRSSAGFISALAARHLAPEVFYKHSHGCACLPLDATAEWRSPGIL